MKVLQINSVCGYGSTGRIATELYNIIESEGYECIIAYGRGTAPEGYNTIKIGTNIDNYMHVVKTRIFDKHGFGSIRATKELVEKIEEYNPDIIHLHNIHGYYVNAEVLFEYLKKSNKKVIWTLHDCWAFTGHCSHFDYIGCTKWKQECYKCLQKKSYPKSILVDNSKFNYKRKKELFTGIKNMTIVTPSQWLADMVKKSFLNKYPVKVINNGINLDIFKPGKSNFRKLYALENKFIILGVANVWSDNKGLNYLIKLAQNLDDKYQIVVVGIDEKQKKQLPNNIIGIAKVDIDALVGIYCSADLFVNPSAEETMGLVTIEALACGTPVIVNNATALPEFVDYSCGRITNIEDIEKTIEIIKLIEKKSINPEECINRARMYEKRKKYKEYIKLYSLQNYK